MPIKNTSKKRKQNCGGFTLVEIICALAILIIFMLPIYRSVTRVSEVQEQSNLQLKANSLARGEMERLINQNIYREGQNTYKDPLGNTELFIETSVEAMPSTIVLDQTEISSWHIRLIFKEIYEPLTGTVSQVDIYDNTGIHKGTVYAKTISNHTGLICTLSYNNIIDFTGIQSYLRFSPEELSALGIDLTKPGTDESSLKIKCEGELNEKLDFYFNVEDLHPSSPKYELLVYNNIDKLNIRSWPGANRNLRLYEQKYNEGSSEIQDSVYRLTVKVFKSEEQYLQGVKELISLKSIRHETVIP